MITRKDIADRLGVSVSVVSRALNNSGYVEKEKKMEILRLAEALNYHPNPVAVSLMTQRTRQILFYCRDLRNAFYIDMYTGMLQAAVKRNYLVVIFGGYDFQRIRQTMVDGIIFPSENVAEQFQRKERRYHIPAVAATYGNSTIALKRLPVVEVDLWKGMNKIFNYLTELGHRKIALSTPYDFENEEVRTTAWKDQLRTLGFSQCLEKYFIGVNSKALKNDKRVYRFDDEFLENNLFISEDFYGRGILAAEIFAERRLDASVVICFNDEMAAGFCRRIQELGFKVPGDISVVGCDCSFARKYATPSLDTLDISPVKIGERCTEVLLDIIDGKRVKQKYSIEPYLRKGETVKQLR